MFDHKQWRKDNKKHIVEYDKQYRQEHKEQITKHNKQYCEDNPEYAKQYRKDNKEWIAAKKRKYYLANKKSYSKRRKQWYQVNKEHCKQYQLDNKERIANRIRLYYLANREKELERAKRYSKTPAGRASQKANKHNRRAMLKGLTKAIVQRVYEANIIKYGQLTCVLCFKPIEFGEDSLEHLLPLSRGGTNDFENLGIAHWICNVKKRAKTLDEWYKKEGIKSCQQNSTCVI